MTHHESSAAFGVHSEVGVLRKVIVHRPGLEMRRLTPSNAAELLFDDVIWARKAGIEHDENDPGEMGWFPLGRACARKYDLSDLAQESWDYETREALYTKGAKS